MNNTLPLLFFCFFCLLTLDKNIFTAKINQIRILVVLVVSACPLRMQLELVEHDPMVPMFSSAHCTDVFIFPSPTNIEQQCIYSNIPSSIVTFTGASTTICVCVCVCVGGGGGGGGN